MRIKWILKYSWTLLLSVIWSESFNYFLSCKVKVFFLKFFQSGLSPSHLAEKFQRKSNNKKKSNQKIFPAHTQKYFSNLIKSTRNHNVFTIFRLIWNTNGRVRLVPNQSENGKYNLISGWCNKISKSFLCTYTLIKSFMFRSGRGGV